MSQPKYGKLSSTGRGGGLEISAGRYQTILVIFVMIALQSLSRVSTFQVPPFARRQFVPSANVLPARQFGSHSMVATREMESPSSVDAENLPELGSDGLYHIMNGDQHKAFLQANQDKLVVLKVFAPWCRACKGLEPKFNAIAKDEKYENLPIVWADLTIQGNKDYVKSIGVLALPSVQFYVHGGLTDNFPCGPSKVPILKRKLTQFVNQNIDSDTLTVRSEPVVQDGERESGEAAATATMSTEAAQSPTAPSTSQIQVASDGRLNIPEEQRKHLQGIQYLKDLSEEEFESVLSSAQLWSFEMGSIIMREGGMGRTFYVIVEGEVEVCQKTSMEDPLTTPSSYLGTVINRLEVGDFFGERAIITGEPRAASIRSSSEITRCLVFDQGSFPPSCILSGKTNVGALPTVDQELEVVNEKYGLSLRDTARYTEKSLKDALTANQIRGSVNTPEVIDGVDNDNIDVSNIDISMDDEEVTAAAGPAMSRVSDSSAGYETWTVDGATIIPLMMRFKMIRIITRCFDYIMQNRPQLGEAGALRRRSMFLKLLPSSQLAEFKDAYALIDADGDGEITLMELRRLMQSVGEEKSDDELMDLLQSGNDSTVDGKQVITYQEFMGIMAEAELYYLFLDTFRALDKMDSGFVKASDLDRVLCGVRDLVSDDRKSIIDVEDTDMMIDYERFSQMLVGSALR